MREQENYNISNLKKSIWILRKAIHNCFFYVAEYGLILVIITLMKLAVSVVNKEVINQLTRDVQSQTMSKDFFCIVLLYLVLYFFEKSSGFIEAYGTNCFRFQVDGFFNRLFMWKSSKQPQELFFYANFMDRFTLVSQHINSISAYIGGICNFVCFNIGYIVGIMILFAKYEPLLIVYAILVAIISFKLNKHLSKCEYELSKKQVRNQRRENYLYNLLSGRDYAKELRIFKTKECFLKKWRTEYLKLREECLEMTIRRTKLWNKQSRIFLYLRMPAVSFLIFRAMNGNYDIGTFVMLFGLIQSCVDQISNISFNIIQGTYKDTKYLRDYFDYIYPISDEEIHEMKKSYSENKKLGFGNFRTLELQGVSYTYPNGEKKAVENITLKISKGEIISILGYNGSGKTTLSKIINGSLIPQEGIVLINGKILDGRNNVFSYFGNMPQEYSKFSISIRDHVGIGRVELMDSDDSMHEAYSKARLNELIAKCDLGENTILGKEYEKEGVNISGGEWQRLILASAYMGNPEILLLDEPSASIDSYNEEEILQNIRRNFDKKTVILISHRISFARLADRIIMMDNGKIVEEGSHEELLKKKGYYSKIFNNQRELYCNDKEQ
jgi:ABC-type multidrug transport system fused ATPase/permease subunit